MSTQLRRFAALTTFFAATALAAQDGADPDLLFSQQILQGAAEGDRLGFSVAISADGETIAAGAPRAGEAGTLSGAVHLFARQDDGTWRREQILVGEDTTAFDAFGLSVALNDAGTLLAVGAPLHDASLLGNSGAVYLFERPEGSYHWSQIDGKLTVADAHENDQFGTSVAISDDGSVVVVGAPQPNPQAPSDEVEAHGKVYVFKNDSSSPATLTASREHNFDYFGFSVAISGDGERIVAGAPGDDGNGDQSGAAYLFRPSNGEWNQPDRQPLHIKKSPPAGAQFGVAAAISERDDGSYTIVVGARDSMIENPEGSVYVFELPPNGWDVPDPVQLRTSTNDVNRFGTSVAIGRGGKTIIAGDLNNPTVSLFLRPDDGWSSEQEEYAIPFCGSSQASTQFGRSVAIGRELGTHVGAGAPMADVDLSSDAGSVCVFDLTGLRVEHTLTTKKLIPGKRLKFEITVTNSNESKVGPFDVKVTFDAALTDATLTDEKLTCKVDSGVAGCFGASTSIRKRGSKWLARRIDELGAGDDLIFYLKATIDPGATGMLESTVVELNNLSGKFRDATPVNNISTTEPSKQELFPRADLRTIKLSLDPRNVIPGRSDDFNLSIKVMNDGGPSDAPGAILKGWEKVIGGGSQLFNISKACHPASGSSFGTGKMKIDEVDLAVGEEADCYLRATVRPAATGSITFISVIEPPGEVKDPDYPAPHDKDSNNRKRIVVALTPRADLSVILVTPESGWGTAVPGDPEKLEEYDFDLAEYTFDVHNHGWSDVTGADVTGIFPTELLSVSTCSKVRGDGTGSECGFGGNLIDENLNIVAGETVRYTVRCFIDPCATEALDVNFHVDPGQDVERNDDDNTLPSPIRTVLTPKADLSVESFEGPEVAVPGLPLPEPYVIKVYNDGPSCVNGGSVTTILSPALGAVRWCGKVDGNEMEGENESCDSEGHGNVSDTMVNLLPEGRLLYTVEGTVDAGAVRELVNWATASAPEGVESNPGNDGKPNNTNLQPLSDLAISVSDGRDTAVPGSSVPLTYTITVTNSGPSDAVEATVVDVFPEELQVVSWSCTADNGSCTPVGAGNVNDTVSVRAGGRLTYTATVLVDAGARDAVVNAASVATAAGVDPRGENNQATDRTILTPVSDLSVSVSDGVDTAVPGNPLPVIYTITVSNAGPSDARDVLVRQLLSSEVTSVTWTCEAIGGSCTPAGDGNVVDTVSLQAGGTLSYTVEVLVGPGATGELTNTVTVKLPDETDQEDPRTDNNEATDTDTLTPVADLAIAKFLTPDGNGDGSVSYTITVTNAGPSDAGSATVTDQLPAGFTVDSWTCTASDGSCNGCPADGCEITDGIGCLEIEPVRGIEDEVSLRRGGRLTYVLQGRADGDLSNVACVTVMEGTDPRDDNNVSEVAEAPAAIISATKEVSGQPFPGGTIAYVLMVSHDSPEDAGDPGEAVAVELTDVLAAELILTDAGADAGTLTRDENKVTWTGSLAPGSSATVTIQAEIAPDTVVGTTVSNQALIVFDSNGNGVMEAALSYDPNQGPGAPTELTVEQVVDTPALSKLGLALMALLVAVASLLKMLRSRSSFAGRE